MVKNHAVVQEAFRAKQSIGHAMDALVKASTEIAADNPAKSKIFETLSQLSGASRVASDLMKAFGEQNR